MANGNKINVQDVIWSGSTGWSSTKFLRGDGTFASALTGFSLSTNVIPKGSGTTISDGTWAFSGNTLYPLTDISSIGLSGTNRVDTIYLGSNLDYANNLIFKTSNTEVARFNSSGYFGIGVTNPINTLDVNGSFRFSTPTETGTIVSATDGGSRSQINITRLGVGYSGLFGLGEILRVDGTTVVIGELSVNTASALRIGTHATGTVMINVPNKFSAGEDIAVSGHLMLRSALTGIGITILDSTGSNNIFNVNDNGKVGVGVANPSARLHIKGIGSGSTGTTLSVTNVDTTASMSFSDDGVFAMKPNFNGYNLITYDSAGNTAFKFYTDTASSNEFQMLQNGTLRGILRATGDSGLLTGISTGSFTVGYTSGVIGRFSVQGATSDNSTYVAHFKKQDATPILSIRSDGTSVFGTGDTLSNVQVGIIGYGTGSTTYGLQVHSSGGTSNSLVVSDNGRVGMGVSTPLAPLHLVSTYTSVLNSGVRVTGPQASISFADNGGNGNSRNFTFINALNSAGVMQLMTSTSGGANVEPTTEFVSFDAVNGRVMVNISQPHATATSTKLLLNGNAAIGSVAIDANAPVDGLLVTGTVGIGNVLPEAKLDIVSSGNTSSSYGLKVQNSSGTNNALVVRDDGNIGVGTDTPFSTLDVRGSVNVQSLSSTGDTIISLYDSDNDLKFYVGSDGLATIGNVVSSGSRFTINGFSAQTAITRFRSTSNLNVLGINDNGTISAFGASLTGGIRLGIKGSGTTSATTVLSVVNSANTATFKVFDNGTINIGNFGAGGGGIGNADGVVAIANATTNPTVPPVGGGILFVSGGTLAYMGSSGTITVLALP